MGDIRIGAWVIVAFALLASAPGCLSQHGGRFAARSDTLRISSALRDADPQRRASLRLILDGLDADVEGQPARARGSYERAMQVDPTNPYAYLAFARHYVDGTEPDRALPLLDQAEALFAAQGEDSPSVQVHLAGLRGEVHYSSGRIAEGVELLQQARDLAPYVWSDGHLSAEELR